MIQREQADRQVLRLSVGLGMAQVDIATDEITDALKRASRDPEHAARIVTELLKRPDRLPTPAEIQSLAQRTDLEVDPREWRCSDCNRTGWKQVFLLYTWSGPYTKSVQVISREQFEKLQTKVSGIIGEQVVIKASEDCHCAVGQRRVEGRAKDALEEAEKAAKKSAAGNSGAINMPENAPAVPAAKDGEKLWYTVQDLAKEWDPISEGWIRDHATRKQPRIKGRKFGKRIMFHRDDIKTFLDEIATVKIHAS